MASRLKLVAVAEHDELAGADRPLVRAHRAVPGQDVGEGVERRVPGQRRAGRRAPSVAWAIVIGVWVPPGPTWPAMSPAMRRTSAPPSGDDSSTDSSASRFW